MKAKHIFKENSEILCEKTDLISIIVVNIMKIITIHF